jgi:hypothetical protein
MSKYDSIKKYYRQQSAEAKLSALRSEMLTPIATIRGYAHILSNLNNSDVNKVLPEEFSQWVESISKAGDELQELLDALIPTD